MVRIQFHTYGGYCREMRISVVEIRFRTYGEYYREIRISVVEIRFRLTFVMLT